jgi:serine/threonine-protein kinase
MDSGTLNELLEFIEADFRVTEKFPASGQREVFRAKQTSNGNNCVLKVCAIHPVRVARIQREIRVLESLDSEYFPRFFLQSFITENILEDFYDNFDLRDDRQRQKLDKLRALRIKPFLLTVEEYIENIAWRDCLAHFRSDKNLVELLSHLFSALSLLWKSSLVHRDLKPENILIRPDFRPVIIDLGIAKSFRAGTFDITHHLFPSPCTPQYAAPEQLTNSKTEVTYKTDQFSVGVLTFLILTNRFPYGDESVIGVERVVDNLMHDRMENLRDYNQGVHEKLALFVEKLLQVRPYKRFRNIETILQCLAEIKELIQ